MTSARPSAIDVLSQRGLPATRALIRKLHVGLDKAASAFCPSVDLQVDGADGPLPARLYIPPASAAGGALMVYFHGGGFVLCDIESHDSLCRRLAAASAMRILSVEYRLAPEHRFPAMHRDAEAAYAWALSHSAELQCDPERIGLGGDSAGGHMAAWLALRGEAKPKFLALLYPLLDVEAAQWEGSPMKDLRFLGRLAVGYVRSQIEDFEETGGSLESFRIVDADFARLPSTVVVEVGIDPLKPGISAFAAAARAAGAPIVDLVYPTLTHGALNFAYLSKQAARAIDETGATLRTLVEGSEPG
jgi:acetyl esterase